MTSTSASVRVVLGVPSGEIDLQVEIHDDHATVATFLACAAGDLGLEAITDLDGIVVDGRRVPRDHHLAEAGLVDGCRVDLGAPPPPVATELDAAVVVTGGLGAGDIHPIGGRARLGRAADAEVRLPHRTVSEMHAEVTRRAGGGWTIADLGSTNGTEVRGRGEPARLGAVEVRVVPRPVRRRTGHLDPLRHAAAGRVPFDRPPRVAPPPTPGPVSPPAPPDEPQPPLRPGVATLGAPLLLGLALVVMTGNLTYALFTLMMPLMALGTWLENRRRARRTGAESDARFGADLTRFTADLDAAVSVERTRRLAYLPDLGEVRLRAHGPDPRLWERRPDDPDFLHLRIGTGDVSWRPALTDRPVPPAADGVVAERSTLRGAPVGVDLREGGVVGIVGARPAALALARGLVAQAAVQQGPADLGIAVVTTDLDPDTWGWTAWLPHTADPTLAGRRHLGAGRDADDVLAGLLGAPWEDRTVLLVVDGEALTSGPDRPARALLRGAAGPVAGIVLAEHADRLPAVCDAIVELTDTDGSATVTWPARHEQVADVLASGLAPAAARALALDLARYLDPEVVDVGARLPEVAHAAALAGTDVGDPDAVLRRWQAAADDPGAAAAIGVGSDGPLVLDLVADGPHALVAGTTGAGKSELLRSWVAGLAVNADPDHLNLVLVDYKGGSAFDACADLPHTVGLVTDLDAHLGERALTCLEAELHHRERVLRAAGAPDLPAYLRLPAAAQQSMPRLVVVIDEFATLAAELPDFVDALVGVAQRGRSLGVHLVLATQRPSGAVNDNIRANTNLRIALRVQDDADSTDVIGAPDAARIPRGRPGRAYVRRGPGELEAIQAALVTGRSARTGAPVSFAPVRFAPSATSPGVAASPSARGGPAASERVPVDPGGGSDHAHSDLDRIVAAARGAFERGGYRAPRRPWPEPLPTTVGHDDLAPIGGTVTVLLEDDPAAQTRRPAGWDPASNLFVIGAAGSGRTTTLRSLVIALTRDRGPDAVHVYVLDHGAGGLTDLEQLPHVGGVIAGHDSERRQRLLRMLRSEVERRRASGAGAEAPLTVLVVDGVGSLLADLDAEPTHEAHEAFVRLATDGASVGVVLVATADRPGAVPHALLATTPQRWVMRLADPHDGALLGVGPVVADLPPGRVVMAATGRHAQVALAPPTAGAGAGVGRVTDVRGEHSTRDEAAGGPRPVGRLPDAVEARDIADEARLEGEVWELPVGIADDDLEVADVRLHPGEHLLVAGPARSGRSSVLAGLAEVAQGAGVEVVAIDGRRPGNLGARLDAVTGPALVILDDADLLDESAGAVVGAWLDRIGDDVHVVAAGRADALRSAYGHWTRTIRRSRVGVLLQPDVDLDGELLGVRLPRHAPTTVRAGRGYVVADGVVRFVQALTAQGGGARSGRHAA